MKLGTIVAFVALLRKLYSPASDLAGVHVDVVTSYAYFDRIFAVLDLEPDIRNAPDAIELPEMNGRHHFRGLSFSYGPDEPLLRDIDLDIAPGEMHRDRRAVGRREEHARARWCRGCTTRRPAPSWSTGTTSARSRLKSLRSHIGVVTQETYMFHASILENLRYARPTPRRRRWSRRRGQRRSTTSSRAARRVRDDRR